MAHETLNRNTTTHVNVGNIATDHGVLVTWGATRGSLRAAGQTAVLSKGSGNTPDWNNSFFGDDVGLSMTATFSGNNLRLSCVVDSAANNVEFYYNLATIEL